MPPSSSVFRQGRTSNAWQHGPYGAPSLTVSDSHGVVPQRHRVIRRNIPSELLAPVAEVCQSRTALMSGNLKTLRASSHPRLPDELVPCFKELLHRYLEKHAHHMTPQRYAACHAAAIRVALHGPPPNRQARLAYRRWKKWRASKRTIEEYGDPTSRNPVGTRTSIQERHYESNPVQADTDGCDAGP